MSPRWRTCSHIKIMRNKIKFNENHENHDSLKETFQHIIVQDYNISADSEPR